MREARGRDQDARNMAGLCAYLWEALRLFAKSCKVVRLRVVRWIIDVERR